MSKKLVALAGNPNVGKSTVFNELTGMHRHTGNWIGKTVESDSSGFYYKNNDYTLVDLPGTYSLDSLSYEEQIARDFLKNSSTDVVVCVVDCSLLERSLPFVFQILSLTPNIVVMLNLCDQAKKKGIYVNAEKLSDLLGVPVVKATAKSGKGINHLLDAIDCIVCGRVVPPISAFDNKELYFVRAKAIAAQTVSVSKPEKIHILDRILLGKYTSYPAMALLFAFVLWITISVSNYPSDLLKGIFDSFELWLGGLLSGIGVSDTLVSLIVFGILRVLLWVVSVMLPPMAIFFPLFALMEDFGILPRVAFNLDRCFQCCGACGKQSLTCCMGLGCNAIGVTGARIIDSPRERLLAIVTNSLIPCNGRLPQHTNIHLCFCVY